MEKLNEYNQRMHEEATARKNHVQAMRDKGLSCIEIAKDLAVSRQRVYQILSRGAKTKRKRVRRTKAAQLVQT